MGQTDNLSTSKIYLASKSPRRAKLLKQIKLDFELLTLDVVEEQWLGEDYLAYSKRVCHDKALAGWKYLLANELALHPVLGADTEVIYQNQILGKPTSYEHAFKIWRQFAGSRHLVLTSICLKYHDFCKIVTSQSYVYVDELSDAEIHNYLQTGDYIGKSGAYGIQSLAGQYINKIDGCFYAIMGLPLSELRRLLKELAVDANH